MVSLQKANAPMDHLISIEYRHPSIANWSDHSLDLVSFTFLWRARGRKNSGWIRQQQFKFVTPVAIARSDAGFTSSPRPCSSLLSATDETEFYRQLAPFTAFLEAITRLSPPHQPWVSTHWRTVKNLLSLSCISFRGGATERIWFSKLVEKISSVLSGIRGDAGESES